MPAETRCSQLTMLRSLLPDRPRPQHLRGRYGSRGAREIHLPVGLPGRAAVGRKRLFPARVGAQRVQPQETHADRLALETFVGVEDATAFSACAFETAFHRDFDAGRMATIEPPDAPDAAGHV